MTEGDQVVEDTYDWYAQDADGNLWYLGEDTTEYENGKPKTKEGSWETGVDGALPGIIMPADPRVGMTYREEYYRGHAEDDASIISTNALAKVPYGRFENGVQTQLQRYRARRDRGRSTQRVSGWRSRSRSPADPIATSSSATTRASRYI